MVALVKVNLGGRTVKQLTTGRNHTCAMLDNNSIKCWGNNTNGELGYEDTNNRGGTVGSMSGLKAVNLGVGRTAKAVAAWDHTCAILDDNSVKCWGPNYMGQLGYDDTTMRGKTPGSMADLRTVNLGTNRTAKAIAVGNGHTCAILDDNSVKCWGYNYYGQLGYDDTTDRGRTSGSMAALGTVNLGAGHTAKAITTGQAHTCAILDDNSVKCWGLNYYGQLGYDDTTDRGKTSGSMASLGVVNLGSGRTANAIAVGDTHTCAMLDNDTVKCWGYNLAGQLGYDDATNRGDNAGEMASLADVLLYPVLSTPTPTNTRTVTNTRTSTNTATNTNTRTSTKTATNTNTRTSTNTPTNTNTPTKTATITNTPTKVIQQINAGSNNTCVIADNRGWCWGGNGSGQLGNQTNSNAKLPVNVRKSDGTEIPDLDQIARNMRGDHNCALDASAQLWCWGSNSEGQLGDGVNLDTGLGRNYAQLVKTNSSTTLANVTDASLGLESTCAIASGTVYCWGLSLFGETGYVGQRSYPTIVKDDSGIPFTGASKISSGQRHTCVIKSGSVWCWGQDRDGQLGDGGALVDSKVPVRVKKSDGTDLTDVNQISNGQFYTCALTTAGAVWCWGMNPFGQLGDGTIINKSRAVQVKKSASVLLSGVSEISAGAVHVCARISGEIWCWGKTRLGNLVMEPRLTGFIPCK
jgi:alpha-tubulin suppressor-like RCC1 family protein